ncbi:cysteine synthase A [bacterium]|jgi:cysteine synthase|nr:cysteine synthase A [bacterium]
MTVKSSVLELVGKTPLISLDRILEAHGIKGVRVLAKAEFANPSGSVKDRAALAMIELGEKSGKINKDTEIIEPTSGNTGIALAMICAVKGYSLTLTMPDSMSLERRKLLSAYGAKTVLTPAHLGMEGSINKAVDLADSMDNAYIPQQFENKANPMMHQRTTAEEIWTDTNGNLDMFVTTIGTGGTFTGISRMLKDRLPDLKTIAVEPKDSAVISGGTPGPHMIQGIGAGFIPKNLDMDLVDEVLLVSNERSFELTRQLAQLEGLLCGMSSGANVAAALELAQRPESQGQTIVTILCDFGERYLSTTLFNNGNQ